MRPSGVTWALLAAALASAALVRFDPWQGGRAPVPMVSTQSAARRVFPGLGEADLAGATLVLARAGEPELRLSPGDDGLHAVRRGEALLGWADPEAVSGLWSSLRMATTLRAVAEGSSLGPARGEISVLRGDLRDALTLHGDASDGSGVYGALADGSAWVVEPELAEALAQPAEAWLSRRLLPLEAGDCVHVRWDSLELARGQDGLWRVVAGGPALLLADAAVGLRLDRAFSAEFEPLAPDAAPAGELAPWLEATDAQGRVRRVLLGPPCPGEPGRRVADRGPGLRGCVDAEIAAPWPVDDPESGLVEPQLVPYAYGRVLAVQQQAPAQRRLRRLGGGWVIDEGGALVEVAEPEVFRWWSALQSAPVELPATPLAGFAPSVDLTVEADSGQQLRLRCGPATRAALACRRDEGPPLLVAGGELLALAFARETFADRRLLSFGSGEIREVEVLPGPGSATVRQSARLDLGVWRLDAPPHPDGIAVLDAVRLEAMLAALQAARAEVWTDAPVVSPQRTLRVERSGGGEGTLSLDLYEGCVAHVPGQRQAAVLAASTCAALMDDLLYDDPLRACLREGRRIELTIGEATASLRRDEGDAWTLESGDAALLPTLAGWEEFRAPEIRSGTPRGSAAATAKVHRPGASTLTLELGPTVEGAPAWARLRGADWYYAGAGL